MIDPRPMTALPTRPSHASRSTEDSPRADAEAAEAKDDVAPQLPETLRFGYVPATVPNGAHNGSDIAGQDPAADDGADGAPADDAPAEPERESPPVNAVPLRDDDQLRPRPDAPRPVRPIPTVPESSSHRVAFVCLAAVIGLILVMLSRGRRDRA